MRSNHYKNLIHQLRIDHVHFLFAVKRQRGKSFETGKGLKQGS